MGLQLNFVHAPCRNLFARRSACLKTLRRPNILYLPKSQKARITPVRMALPLSSNADAAALSRSPTQASWRPQDRGTLLLCIICALFFMLDNLLHLKFMSMLALHHSSWKPYQLVTSLFCHASFDHLSSNLFQLLVFGRFVEEEAGALGVVLAFLVCGACANVASLILLRAAGPIVSLGASGSVFSLFTLAILVRFRFRPGRLIEAFILSTHVAARMRSEFAAAVGSAGAAAQSMQVNHIAHIAGALAGVLLVLLLNFIVRNSSPPSKLKPSEVDGDLA